MSRSVGMDYDTLRNREQCAPQLVHHNPERPVSAWDLLGIAPDWTGGMSTEEWVREQRER